MAGEDDVSPGDSNEGRPDQASVSFQQLFSLMQEGTRNMMLNNFDRAEQQFSDAKEEVKRRAQEHPDQPNLECWVHLIWVLSSVLRGMAALENNQLLQAIDRLREGEKLVDRGPDWVGKRAMRGNLLISQGVLLFMSQSFMSAGGKLLSGLKHFRDIQEAAEYAGLERPLVRSFSLWVAGSANLALSGLPPVLLQVVKWMTNLQGDREQALRDLEAGWREGGLMSAACATMYLNSVLDVNNRGTRGTQDQADLVEQILVWARREYPGSIFFVQLAALVEARRRNVKGAYRILKESLDACENMPAIALVGHGQLCNQALAMLDWQVAAQHSEAIIEVQKSVNRRAHVPENAFVAMLCHLRAGNEASAREMLAIVRAYERERKKDWPIMDSEAFRLAGFAPSAKVLEAGSGNLAAEKEPWLPSLHLWEMVIFWGQLVRNMEQPTVDLLVSELRAYIDSTTDPSLQCRAQLCVADALLQGDRPPAEVLEVCNAGLALVPQLSAVAKDHGCEPLVHYIRTRALFLQGSLLEATEAMRRLEAFRKHRSYLLLSFRLAEIRRALGEQLGTSFRELVVKAWQSSEALFEVPAKLEGEEVSWNFSIKEKNLSFRALFRPSDGDEDSSPSSDRGWTQLDSVDKHDSENGPWAGSFKPSGPGTLKLVFDNSFSWAKRKEVLYQVYPESLLPVQA